MRVAGFLILASLAGAQALEEAKRAFDHGDYASALHLFEQARAKSPPSN